MSNLDGICPRDETANASERPRAHLQKLIVRSMIRAADFNFNILPAHKAITLTPKEKIYIAYAVLMAYAFKTHYQTALISEKEKTEPRISVAIEETLRPIIEGDEALIPDYVLQAKNYAVAHKKDGTVTSQTISAYTDLKRIVGPSTHLESRLKINQKPASKARREEVKRSALHTVDTAPAEVLVAYGIKEPEVQEATTVGCPMLLAGIIGEVVDDAIEFEDQRRERNKLR